MVITCYKNYGTRRNSIGVPATRTRYALASEIGLRAGHACVFARSLQRGSKNNSGNWRCRMFVVRSVHAVGRNPLANLRCKEVRREKLHHEPLVHQNWLLNIHRPLQCQNCTGSESTSRNNPPNGTWAFRWLFAFNFQRAPSKTISCIAISGIVLRERRFCSPQMAVRSLTDQPDRLGTRSRDADLARALAPPDGASSAGCQQRQTLTTSDRSAKRRTPTRLILYRRSFQVVRFEGLVKPASTVCAARCTATLVRPCQRPN